MQRATDAFVMVLLGRREMSAARNKTQTQIWTLPSLFCDTLESSYNSILITLDDRSDHQSCQAGRHWCMQKAKHQLAALRSSRIIFIVAYNIGNPIHRLSYPCAEDTYTNIPVDEPFTSSTR